MICGEYQVTGARDYRGHAPGSTFVARLDPGAERRAIQRGDFVLLRHIEPALEPGSYELPPGWLPAEPSHQPGAGRRLSR